MKNDIKFCVTEDPVIIFDNDKAEVLKLSKKEHNIRIIEKDERMNIIPQEYSLKTDFYGIVRMYPSGIIEPLKSDIVLVYMFNEDIIIKCLSKEQLTDEDIAKMKAMKITQAAKSVGMPYKSAEKVSRDYQLKKSRYNLGSSALYNEIRNFIRLYPEMVESIDSRGFRKKDVNMAIRSHGKISQPTENAAILSMGWQGIDAAIRIIEDAIYVVPEPYRTGVFNHAVYGHPYENNQSYFHAHRNTWANWMQRYVYQVAILRGYGPLIKELKNMK